MYKLGLALDDFKITENYEIVPFRTYDYINREKAEQIKNEIYNIQKEKNISFFLATKEILNQLKSQFKKIYYVLEIGGLEAITIDLDTVKNLDTFFIYNIFACSGSECYHTPTPDIGIMFDSIKIEIIGGKINIRTT